MAKPKYEKIADSLKKDISSGKLASHSKLPKISELAEKFNVSYVTMSNAVQLLQAEGYVNAIQGNGIFVNPPPAQIYSRDIYWHAPIEGDLYGRCFRAAQDIFDEHDCRLIPVMPPDRLRDIALVNPSKAEKFLQDFCRNPVIIEGTRHFPFSLLKKVNPNGKGIFFLLHAECSPHDFPDAVTVMPDYRQSGAAAAERLHKYGIERLFLLTYENISEKELKLANYPESTYENLILEGMNDYAAKNNLPPTEIFRTHDKVIENFDKLLPFSNKKCGFMAIGDHRAHTLYRYARKYNIKIGEKWYVTGMGRTDWCDIIEPHLESISLEEITLVRRLASELLNNEHSKYILLPIKL